jgi:hypothetical protein
MASEKEKSCMTDSDWCMIDKCVRDINATRKGLLDDLQLAEHESNLLSDCEDVEVIDRLKKIASAKADDNPQKHLLYRFLIWLFRLK